MKFCQIRFLLLLIIGPHLFLGACHGFCPLQEPLLGFIGEIPKSVELLEICISRDGDLRCGDACVTYAELDDLVKRRVGSVATRPHAELGVSLPCITAIMSVDKSLPWGAVARIRQLLEKHKIFRVLFKGQHIKTKTPGALALYTPLVIGSSSSGSCVELYLDKGSRLDNGLKSTLGALKEANVLFDSEQLIFQILPRLSASVEGVLHVADMLFRSGAKKVYVKDELFGRDPLHLKSVGKAGLCVDSLLSIKRIRLIEQSLRFSDIKLVEGVDPLPSPCPLFPVTVGTLHEGPLGDAFWEESP